MVIVAHPDDEAFGCGSLIAHAASLGADVIVVCATRGEAGEATRDIAPGSDLAQVRATELRRAVDVLGGHSVDLLDFLDSGFDGDPIDGSLCAAPADVVADVLLDRIDAVHPHVVIVLDGSDGHRDHLRIREAAIEAIGRHEGDVWLFEHSLPNSLMRRWLDEMRTLEPGTAYHSIDPDLFGRPDAEVTDVLDMHHLLDIRQAAIAAHRSQKSPFDRLSTQLRLAFLATDHLVRVPVTRA
jgi:LmbE family N-acetylglucosaminyl deacetylase